MLIWIALFLIKMLSYMPSHSHSLRDRASHNDVIGTTHLCMSKISAPGGDIEGRLFCSVQIVAQKYSLKIQFDWRLLLSGSIESRVSLSCFTIFVLYISGSQPFFDSKAPYCPRQHSKTPPTPIKIQNSRSFKSQMFFRVPTLINQWIYMTSQVVL